MGFSSVITSCALQLLGVLGFCNCCSAIVVAPVGSQLLCCTCCCTFCNCGFAIAVLYCGFCTCGFCDRGFAIVAFALVVFPLWIYSFRGANLPRTVSANLPQDKDSRNRLGTPPEPSGTLTESRNRFGTPVEPSRRGTPTEPLRNPEPSRNPYGTLAQLRNPSGILMEPFTGAS